MHRLFFNISALAGLLLTLQACSGLTYSAKEIHGKIVDADTGQPLEGVNIVAQWQIDRTWVGDDKALLHVTEAVTDKDGNYAFPAWGPIMLPLLADFGEGQDPLLSIFKSGYDVGVLHNATLSGSRDRLTALGEFKWNRATTKLKKWKGGLWDYWWRVNSMSGELPEANNAWRNYPRMLLVLMKEQQRVKELGAPGGLAGAPSRGLTPEDREFLREYER